MALGTPSNLYSFRGGQTQVNCLLLDLDETKELLYIGTSDGLVNIWDLKVNRLLRSVKVSDDACLSVINNGCFITQEKGGGIKFWTQEWTFVKKLTPDYVGFCKISSKVDLLLYPMSQGKFNVYNIKTQDETTVCYKYNKKPGEIMSLLCLEKAILVLYEAGFLSLWDLSGLKMSEIDVSETPMCMDYCENGQIGIVGSSSSTITKFSVQENKLELTKTTEITNPGVSALTLHQSGRIFVAGCWDGSVKYFSSKTLKLLAVITNKPDPIQFVVFAPKALTQWGPSVVFVGGPNEKVSLCNLYSKELSN